MMRLTLQSGWQGYQPLTISQTWIGTCSCTQTSQDLHLQLQEGVQGHRLCLWSYARTPSQARDTGPPIYCAKWRRWCSTSLDGIIQFPPKGKAAKAQTSAKVRTPTPQHHPTPPNPTPLQQYVWCARQTPSWNLLAMQETWRSRR